MFPYRAPLENRDCTKILEEKRTEMYKKSKVIKKILHRDIKTAEFLRVLGNPIRVHFIKKLMREPDGLTAKELFWHSEYSVSLLSHNVDTLVEANIIIAYKNDKPVASKIGATFKINPKYRHHRERFTLVFNRVTINLA